MGKLRGAAPTSQSEAAGAATVRTFRRSASSHLGFISASHLPISNLGIGVKLVKQLDEFLGSGPIVSWEIELLESDGCMTVGKVV